AGAAARLSATAEATCPARLRGGRWCSRGCDRARRPVRIASQTTGRRRCIPATANDAESEPRVALRLHTFLFADLVGFTSFTVRHGDERGDRPLEGDRDV